MMIWRHVPAPALIISSDNYDDDDETPTTKEESNVAETTAKMHFLPSAPLAPMLYGLAVAAMDNEL
jgi:hypothetical protein